MEHVATVATAVNQYLGYILAGLAAIGYALNKWRRDTSATKLQEKADEASGGFVDDLIEDHRRLVTQLREAHDDRAANAEKVGALTAEVNILRGQVGEIKTLLETLGNKLDEANAETQNLEKLLLTKDGDLFRVTVERDAAITRAKAAEKELARLKEKYES